MNLLNLVLLLQVAAVQGRVVDDAGAPIVNARVSVVSRTPGATVVLSDEDGRFEVRTGDRTAGIRVVAVKTGFGRREVSVGAADSDVTIRLPRGVAISGRVLDEFGDAVMNARVAARS